MALRVSDLTFFRHPLAKEMDSLDRPDFPYRTAFASAKQAFVQFSNRWAMSLVTHIPDHPVVGKFGIMIFHGDERIPTYEIAVFDPDGHMGDPYYDMTVDEANRLIAETMSKDSDR